MLTNVFNKLGAFLDPGEDSDDQATHVWVALIALVLLGYLWGVRYYFGDRAV